MVWLLQMNIKKFWLIHLAKFNANICKIRLAESMQSAESLKETRYRLICMGLSLYVASIFKELIQSG